MRKYSPRERGIFPLNKLLAIQILRTSREGKILSLVLRLAQILIGVALVFLSSRVLIKPLDGQLKLITAILCAQLFGYLMVWSNTKILKSSGELGVYKKLKPIKIGHLILPVGSIVIGFGFYSNRQSFVLIGGCIFFVANYLLRKVRISGEIFLG